MQTALSKIPLLENGDRLTQPEFERRYQAMPNHQKAELIEGAVQMASPVRVRHAKPHADLIRWLGRYCDHTPGVDLYTEPTLRLDLDNEPQPDVVLRILEDGSSHISLDGYLEGAPELVAEVALSSVSIDLHSKLNAYRRNGIAEYLVWRVEDEQLDWFGLKSGQYLPLSLNSQGILCSQVFPGLWLDPMALIRGNLAQVMACVQQGIQGSGHADFVRIRQSH